MSNVRFTGSASHVQPSREPGKPVDAGTSKAGEHGTQLNTRAALDTSASRPRSPLPGAGIRTGASPLAVADDLVSRAGSGSLPLVNRYGPALGGVLAAALPKLGQLIKLS